jgi:hypothetical protein
MDTTEKVQDSTAAATSAPDAAGETAKIEPAKVEAAKSEAAKSEPAKPEPFRIGLTTATPRIEPAARPAASERIEATHTGARRAEEPAGAGAGATTAESTPPRAGLSRFALLAASIAAAAGIGAFAGSLTSAGLARLAPGAAPATAAIADPKAAQQLAAKISAEYAALKGNVDSLTRSASAQFAKLGERLDRAERAQAEPAAKLAKIAEAIERLEKHGVAAAAPETTGAITAPAATADAKTPDKPLEGWVLHDVRRGRALIESRYGGMFEVSQGGFLPGVGRVQEIKRQDGRWVVVTSRGTITSYY